MYDIHAHILPGVDDGAKTPEDTVKMAQVAADTGTKIILATPHRKDVTEGSSVAHIRELIEDMNERITAQGNDLKLVLGMENHLDVDLPDEIEAGRALPMNGSRYMLIEMPFFGRPNYIEDVLFKGKPNSANHRKIGWLDANWWSCGERQEFEGWKYSTSARIGDTKNGRIATGIACASRKTRSAYSSFGRRVPAS